MHVPRTGASPAHTGKLPRTGQASAHWASLRAPGKPPRTGQASAHRARSAEVVFHVPRCAADTTTGDHGLRAPGKIGGSGVSRAEVHPRHHYRRSPPRRTDHPSAQGQIGGSGARVPTRTCLRLHRPNKIISSRTLVRSPEGGVKSGLAGCLGDCGGLGSRKGPPRRRCGVVADGQPSARTPEGLQGRTRRAVAGGGRPGRGGWRRSDMARLADRCAPGRVALVGRPAAGRGGAGAGGGGLTWRVWRIGVHRAA